MPYDYDEIKDGLIYTRFYPGPFTHEDRNRVEYATEAMAYLITECGYYCIIVTKTDWNGTDVTADNYVTVKNMSRYLGNISLIRRQFPAVSEYPLPDGVDGWTYEDANNMERLLFDIPGFVEDMKSAYRRCNTFNCGT